MAKRNDKLLKERVLVFRPKPTTAFDRRKQHLSEPHDAVAENPDRREPPSIVGHSYKDVAAIYPLHVAAIGFCEWQRPVGVSR